LQCCKYSGVQCSWNVDFVFVKIVFVGSFLCFGSNTKLCITQIILHSKSKVEIASIAYWKVSPLQCFLASSHVFTWLSALQLQTKYHANVRSHPLCVQLKRSFIISSINRRDVFTRAVLRSLGLCFLSWVSTSHHDAQKVASRCWHEIGFMHLWMQPSFYITVMSWLSILDKTRPIMCLQGIWDKTVRPPQKFAHVVFVHAGRFRQ